MPDGWVWCRLGEIIEQAPENGLSPRAVEYQTNVKSLKLGATTYGKFDPNEYKYLDVEVPADSCYWLKNGDILIQRSNSIEYVGVNIIYEGNDDEFVYPDLMMKIKVLAGINNKYVQKALSSTLVRTYFRNNSKGSQQSMPKINQTTVSNAILPLPPFPKQQNIVEKVDRLMTKIYALEQQVSEREAQARQLIQAVLREAFEGN